MNGPQHYAAAEELLAQLPDYPRGTPESRDLIAEAGVHAQMAQTAAFVAQLGYLHSEVEGSLADEWAAVLT